MKVVYIAGPYRAQTIWGINLNIQAAKEIALQVWKLGFVAMCPHANSAFFDGELDDSLFLDGGVELLRRCDYMVLVGDWEKSEGTKKEIEIAKENNIPIVTLSELASINQV